MAVADARQMLDISPRIAHILPLSFTLSPPLLSPSPNLSISLEVWLIAYLRLDLPFDFLSWWDLPPTRNCRGRMNRTLRSRGSSSKKVSLYEIFTLVEGRGKKRERTSDVEARALSTDHPVPMYRTPSTPVYMDFVSSVHLSCSVLNVWRRFFLSRAFWLLLWLFAVIPKAGVWMSLKDYINPVPHPCFYRQASWDLLNELGLSY